MTNQTFISAICQDDTNVCFIFLCIICILSIIFNIAMIIYICKRMQCCARQTNNSYKRIKSNRVADDMFTISGSSQVPHTRIYPNMKDEVQVYIGNCPATHFVDKLIRHLESKRRANEFRFRMVEGVSDIKPDRPLLVICFNSTRLGTDAINAVKDVQDHKLLILLIFHHKEMHALPAQSSSMQLVGPEYEKLKGIFDIACVKDKGIYNCEMNRTSLSDILEHLRSLRRNNFQ